jgi:hypothetical protein
MELVQVSGDAKGSAQLSTLDTTAGPIAGYQTTPWVDVPL